MNDAKQRLLREKGFGFFGAITASLSHEINNVFAITNELSGLLDVRAFLARVAELQKEPDLDTGRVNGSGKQVHRGGRGCR